MKEKILPLLPKPLMEKCTTHALQAMRRAFDIATKDPAGSGEIALSHLLDAVFAEEGGLGSNILRAHNIKAGDLASMDLTDEPLTVMGEQATAGSVKKAETDSQRPKGLTDSAFSRKVKAALKKALLAAAHYHHKYLGTEHILYGIICEGLKSTKLKRRTAKAMPAVKNRSRQKLMNLKRHIEEIFISSTHFPDIERVDAMAEDPLLPLMLMMQRGMQSPGSVSGGSEESAGEGTKPVSVKSPIAPRSNLSNFCEDLVYKAERGEFDPLVGRDAEVDRLMHILARRMKNNPVLIGEPGVGKTAIVQGLALRIVNGTVPENLQGKRILALDIGSLVAGTMFRGEFESRLKEVLKEAKSKRVILFIDEIHTVVGAGASPGSLDAANMLKPALSQGLIQVIGATTLDEYRKSIEKDPALERRFQPIHVREQSEEEAVRIIIGIKEAYEKHHHIAISDDAIRAAVSLSERYITDRFLPDKAIDVLDEAAAFVHSKAAPSVALPHIREYERALEELKEKKDLAMEKEAYEDALKIKKDIEGFEKELIHLRDVKKTEERQFTDTLNEDDIRHTISRMTSIPIEKLEGSEAEELREVANVLKQHLVGQDEAVDHVSRVLKRARAGLASPKRPYGSFIFLGPTGVGKTELVKILAREAYHNPESLIKFDMSEFMEPHSVSKLIGAPPGYVGYEDEGKLTERIRRNPYSIVLFDEIEKAHPSVFNILLQVLEEGELTSATGRKVSFRNTIIIMTSNVGTDEFTSAATAIGFSSKDTSSGVKAEEIAADLELRFEQIREDALKELKTVMKPELLNRIDAVIVFRPLGKKEIEKIADLELAYLAERLGQNKKLKVMFGKSVGAFIAANAFNPREGARPVRRAIEQHIENVLAEKLIELDMKEDDALHVDIVRDKVVVKKTAAKK